MEKVRSWVQGAGQAVVEASLKATRCQPAGVSTYAEKEKVGGCAGAYLGNGLAPLPTVGARSPAG